MERKHIFTVLVQNQPGVLAHIAGMFAARGFNIDSLVVGRTEDPALSRMSSSPTGMMPRSNRSANSSARSSPS